MIGICTDSNSQIPPDLVARYDVEVVPIVVTIGDREYAEGENLRADDFYAHFEADEKPTVSTSQPSPGRIAAAYQALQRRGATEILSIHLGSAVSGTFNSARLAAGMTDVPVRLVDTGTASFGVTCCVWEAAEAIAAGADIEEAARLAERLAPAIGNVFTVGALDLVRAGGRAPNLASVDPRAPVSVLTLHDGQVRIVGGATDVEEAVAIMAGFVKGWGNGLKVAVGFADQQGAVVSEALEAALPAGSRDVAELIRYRIGPSVGVHTGPGTAGAFMFTPNVFTPIQQPRSGP